MLARIALAGIIAISMVACAESPEGSAALPFRILEPATGETVTVPELLVRGSAPAGERVVRDVSLGRDDEVIADSAGSWLMSVSLDAGLNELVFRLGDDRETATTISVSYQPVETPGPSTPPQEATPRPTPDTTPSPEWEAAACAGLKTLDLIIARLPVLRQALEASDSEHALAISKKLETPASATYQAMLTVGWAPAGPLERALWSASGATMIAVHRTQRAFEEADDGIRRQAILDVDEALSDAAVAAAARDEFEADTGYRCP